MHRIQKILMLSIETIFFLFLTFTRSDKKPTQRDAHLAADSKSSPRKPIKSLGRELNPFHRKSDENNNKIDADSFYC